MSKDSLDKYRSKRDLKRSPEPKGDESVKRGSKHPLFVIHKHDASTAHYDFRLECDGRLKSWAVPKGPSSDPSDNRLAIRTEDHPLDYADFEGVIPEGEYGAGTVMVWDIGPYENAKHSEEGEDHPPDVQKQIEDGHVTIQLHGDKIRGGYALIRTQMGKNDDQEKWLLKKMDDSEADARRNPTSTQNKSAKSGRTMNQIRKEEAASGQSDKDHAG